MSLKCEDVTPLDRFGEKARTRICKQSDTHFSEVDNSNREISLHEITKS